MAVKPIKPPVQRPSADRLKELRRKFKPFKSTNSMGLVSATPGVKQDLIEIHNRRREGGVSPKMVSVPKHMRDLLLTVIDEEHVASWVRTPIPDLGGRTPAEMIRSGRTGGLMRLLRRAGSY